jgi:hypothetical protein
MPFFFIKNFFYYSEKTKRGDTGKYELTLRNAKGEVKVPIDVTVIGKMNFLFDFKQDWHCTVLRMITYT